ncbi:hypothetical protein JCGZ_15640 [Jatropha curcas]|uniref:Glycosyl hydrolase family 32 N-terminal domain-containing protein n=1 Tax=Jatropha curcas TaxID=180498 RepID=A0A067L224_JATCU|nr:hypothetical protein JCGZ_15640 [Jatropha curcas]
MEFAASGSSAPKAFNHLATSIVQRLPNRTSFIPLWPTATRNLLLPASNPISRNKTLTSLITCCSTKPDTNRNNGTSQDSSFLSNSNRKCQNPSIPISRNSLSSSFPPSSLSKGLVFDLGPVNSWDDKEIGSPVVKRFLSDEGERWYMWYYGNSSENPDSDSIGLAISNNGIHWERGVGPVKSSSDVGMVMKCGQDWWAFDTMSIRPSEVVIMSSAKVRASSAVYWLYYSGFNTEKVDVAANDDSLEFHLENPERFCSGNKNKNFFNSLPGLAISQDGRHWARIEGEHHSGALFDLGTEKDWDSLFIASPQVVFHGNGDLRMYYHSFDIKDGKFSIGMARSRDGIRFVKLGKILGGGKICCFDENGVMNASVVKNQKDGKYFMAYEGVAADGKRSIGLAMSLDGLKGWQRLQDEEGVLEPSEKDEWDSKGVGSPCWCKWMVMLMSGDCIIEELETQEELGLEWHFVLEMILVVLEDGLVSNYENGVRVLCYPL